MIIRNARGRIRCQDPNGCRHWATQWVMWSRMVPLCDCPHWGGRRDPLCEGIRPERLEVAR